MVRLKFALLVSLVLAASAHAQESDAPVTPEPPSEEAPPAADAAPPPAEAEPEAPPSLPEQPAEGAAPAPSVNTPEGEPSSPEPAPSAPAPEPVAPLPLETPPPPPGAPLPEPVEREEPSDEVVVLGTRLAETPGSAHVVGEKELDRWEYDDAHAVLQAIPGVYVRQEDGMGLRPNIGLRGVNPDRTKKVTLMEDGVLLGPAPYSAPAAYYFPILTRMTEVRVVKGPGAIAYGPQTVGGAIDLRTRAVPRTATSAADVAAGQYGYGKAHLYAGAGNEQFGFLIEGVRLQNDGFKELDGGGDTGFVRNEWMAKVAYRVDPRAALQNELTLKLTYSDETSNESYLGLTDGDFAQNPNRRYAVSRLDRMQNHRFSVVAGHELRVHRELTVSTQLYRHTYDRTWRKVNGFRGANLFDVLRDPEAPSHAYYHAILRGEAESASAADAILIGPNQREFVSEGAQTTLLWEGDTGPLAHRVDAGIRYHHDTIERRHSENGFLVAGTELIPDGAPTVVTAFNRAETHAVALYVLDAVSYRNLTVTPGVRAELLRFSDRDRLAGSAGHHFDYAILPGVGAYYAVVEHLGFLAGVHRGFSPPPPDSAKSASPEESLNYEAGARYSRNGLRVESIGFYNDYENLTDVCTYSGGCSDADVDRQFDAGAARIYGVEAFASYALTLRDFTLPLLGAYTYSRGEFLRTFDASDPIFANAQKGDEMPYLPRHQARVSVGLEHPWAGFEIAVNHVSAMREEPGQGAITQSLHTDRQVVIDMTARARVLDSLSLYLNVQNLLDEQYVVSHRPFGARPNAPRWLHVGLKASL